MPSSVPVCSSSATARDLVPHQPCVAGAADLSELTSAIMEVLPHLRRLCTTAVTASPNDSSAVAGREIYRPPSARLDLRNHDTVVPRAGTSRRSREGAQSQARNLPLRSTTLMFSDGDIPPPPMLSFPIDMARLNKMWDDYDARRWDNSSPLEILGVRIPVVYWPQLYRYRPTGHWGQMKQRWLDCKVSCEAASFLFRL